MVCALFVITPCCSHHYMLFASLISLHVAPCGRIAFALLAKLVSFTSFMLINYQYLLLTSFVSFHVAHYIRISRFTRVNTYHSHPFVLVTIIPYCSLRSHQYLLFTSFISLVTLVLILLSLRIIRYAHIIHFVHVTSYQQHTT